MNLRIFLFFSIFIFINPQGLQSPDRAGIKVSLLPSQLNTMKDEWYQYFLDHVNEEPVKNITSQGYELTNAQINQLKLNPEDITLTLGDESIFIRAEKVDLNANFDISKGNRDINNASMTSTGDLILIELKVYLNNSNPLFYLRNITLTLNNIIIDPPTKQNLRFKADRPLYVAITNLLLRHLQSSINLALRHMSEKNQNTFKIPATPLIMDVRNLVAPTIDADKLTYYLNGSSYVINQPSKGQNVRNGDFPDYDPNATQGYQVFIGDDVINSALFGLWANNDLAINIGNYGEANPIAEKPSSGQQESTEAEAQQSEGKQSESGETNQNSNNESNGETNNQNNAEGGEQAQQAALAALKKRNRTQSTGIATFDYSIILANGTVISNNQTITIPIKFPNEKDKPQKPSNKSTETDGSKGSSGESEPTQNATGTPATGGQGGEGEAIEVKPYEGPGGNAGPGGLGGETIPTQPETTVYTGVGEGGESGTGQNQDNTTNQTEANQNGGNQPPEGSIIGGIIVVQNQEAAETGDQNESQQNETKPSTEAEAAAGAGAEAGGADNEQQSQETPTETPAEAQTETPQTTDQQTKVPVAPYALIPPVKMTTDLIDAVIPGLEKTYGPDNSVLFNCYYDDPLPPQLTSKEGSMTGSFNGSCKIFVKKQDNWNLALVLNALANITSVVQFSDKDTLNYAININDLSNLTTSESAIGKVDDSQIESNINELLLGKGPFVSNIRLPLQNVGEVNNPLVLIKDGFVEVLADIVPLPLI